MAEKVIDPVKYIKWLWPEISLYDKQRQILYSLRDNDETIVPAGNMLGKDFIAGLGVLWYFQSRHPCRIVTTSVDATQLNAVLWGEMRRFIQDAVHPLDSADGGPLVVNDSKIRKIVKGKMCGLSYILGRVASDTGEGMLGHHIAKTGDGIPRSLFVADEASGVPHIYWDKADTWADRKLAIGNCYPCENFFKYAVDGRPGTPDKGGDIKRTSRAGFFRKVIHIQAEDSPNVKLGILQKKNGKTPTNEMLIPGVKDYETYCKNLLLWDDIKKSVSLWAKFYKGSDQLLYPPHWLNRAESIAMSLRGATRKAKTMGVDPGEGSANTVWTSVDDFGIIEQISKKTPDTSEITKFTLVLMAKHGIKANDVLFDAGGGGKQYADKMRDDGYPVRAVGFGETASDINQFRRMRTSREKTAEKENRYVYKNRRAEMYGILREVLDPANGMEFGIDEKYTELRRQLSPLPLLYDAEGRLYLPPKNKPSPDSKVITLKDILGCSPDEADSTVLAVFGLIVKANQSFAGVVA